MYRNLLQSAESNVYQLSVILAGVGKKTQENINHVNIRETDECKRSNAASHGSQLLNIKATMCTNNDWHLAARIRVEYQTDRKHLRFRPG